MQTFVSVEWYNVEGKPIVFIIKTFVEIVGVGNINVVLVIFDNIAIFVVPIKCWDVCVILVEFVDTLNWHDVFWCNQNCIICYTFFIRIY